MLKGRFNRLRHVNFLKISDICLFVIAVCTVYNFCIAEKESDDFEVIPEEEVNDFFCMGSSTADGERKRDNIAEELFENMD